jgi:ribosomal protein L6P/L9E
MSRIAKNPVVVPKGVSVAFTNGEISVKGPLGEISRVMNPVGGCIGRWQRSSFRADREC